ncbi:hypothetical protein KC19_4G188300 [Ceratodon purpureus]|uniref:Protein kinase domain-containing protein n=1 Tax=Ceratodon purpureus TaxID=3225 RepID=A0A8T0IA53_CERPU|nr:hypothetical protein KC19_4G188300 [Ceratodon purpureus]
MPRNGNRIGSYTENGNGLLEVVGSNHCHSSNLSSEALQLTVKGRRLDHEDSDSESPRTSEGSSQGSSERMEDPTWFSEGGKRGLSPLSVKALEDVVGQVLKNVRAAGYGEAVCTEFREHFARLPSRYTLNIDPQRHEDVLLHMELLHEAREAEHGTSYSFYDDALVVPCVHVRKVQLTGFGSPDDFSPTDGKAVRTKRGVQIPKPTFGSTSNLLGLGIGNSPKVHPSEPLCRSRPTPPRGTPPRPPSSGNTSPGIYGLQHTIPRRSWGNFINPLHMEEEAVGYTSDLDDLSPSFGYEVNIATTDRLGLLKYLTSALSDSHLQLNIKEAHVFSTTDGMALEVFVVEGWPGDEAEELKKAILVALDEKLPGRRGRGRSRDELRAAAEAIQYEDWAVDYNMLQIGEQLGTGSTGRLFKGKYLSQDVAIKIILIGDCSGSGTDGDTHQSAPAAERLQIYKQEISIMRLVRHKNVVQFIGACSKWPQLCIVTELMAGGSVRDVLESRRSGLDFGTAIKVLRDAARGMDFLHKRGVIHRDLKAANLLIDEYDVVKVCDFGVARLKPPSLNAAEKSEKFSAEMTAETGTYRWMSPEVLEHKPYNHKADVYSFGITMWEVLTGEVPYSGLTPLQAAIGVVQRYTSQAYRSNALWRIVIALSTLLALC